MKQSRAFQLHSIQDHIVCATKVDEQWYPCKKDDVEIFIRGNGWVKLKGEKPEVGNLPIEWTAKDLQYYHKFYGSLAICEGLLEGWGGNSLYQDSSYGLNYAKAEIRNMVIFGDVYDEYTDYIQKIGDEFIANLHEGYRIEGGGVGINAKIGGTLWYKDYLICFLDRVHLHPLMHVEHLIKGLVPIKPSFDPISFDKMMIELLVAESTYEDPSNTTNMIHDRIVSVRDRIAYLSNEKIAEDFIKIFEMEKGFITGE